VTLVVLVRHAHSTANQSGLLVGQLPGVHLSVKGIEQADLLSQRLGKIPVKTLRVSPLERCHETIAPWKTEFGGKVALHTDPGLSEMDYGSWSGSKLRTLTRRPLWKTVQAHPSRVTFPDGESMMAMQARALKSVHTALEVTGNGHVLMVSHGDVLKAIITGCLGLHLDELQRFVVDPASVSVLDFSSSKPRLLLMNDSRSHINELLNTKHSKRLLLGGGAGFSKSPRKR